jgi:hypothetical protein
VAALSETAPQIRWSADGKELFDLSNATAFDVTSDGRRFLVTEPAGEAADPPIVFVQNWWKLLGR